MQVVQPEWGEPASVLRERPLRLGLSIGHANGTCGTLGPFVLLRNGKMGFLSSASAVAPPGAKRGDFIHQPSLLDGVSLTGATRAGTLVDFMVAPTEQAVRIDAAVVELFEGEEPVGNFVREHGHRKARPIAKQVADPREIVGAAVSCIARSGLCHGQVAAVEIENFRAHGFGKVKIYSGCIEVKRPDGAFSHPGDAGALVYRRDDFAPIGIIFASAQNEEGNPPATYLLPLTPAIELFGLSLL